MRRGASLRPSVTGKPAPHADSRALTPDDLVTASPAALIRDAAPAARPPTATSTTSSRSSSRPPSSPTSRSPTDVVDNVLVYDAAALRAGHHRAGRGARSRPSSCGPSPTVRASWPIRGAFPDTTVVDRATAAFDAIIADGARRGRTGRRPLRQGRRQRPRVERAGEAGRARPGRVRRLLRERHARAVSRCLARARATRSPRRSTWSARAGRRRTRTATTTWASSRTTPSSSTPTHVHLLSPVLTLQGAVAHCDMPVESGPTMYLPYSHQYDARLPRLAAARVPRLLRASTTSSSRWPRATPSSSTRRCSTAPAPTSRPTSSASPTCCRSPRRSAGRWRPWTATECVRAVYPVLLDRKAAGVDRTPARHALAAAAEGYPFPTNLDLDQPVGGLTPPSQAEVVRRRAGRRPSARALAELDGPARRRTPAERATASRWACWPTRSSSSAAAPRAWVPPSPAPPSGRSDRRGDADAAEDVGEAFAAELEQRGGRRGALRPRPTSPTWRRRGPASPRWWTGSAGSTAWSTRPD